MSDTHESLQQRIAEDRAQNPGCSYSTLRSSASTFLNGSSRAETLTRIIRCVLFFFCFFVFFFLFFCFCWGLLLTGAWSFHWGAVVMVVVVKTDGWVHSLPLSNPPAHSCLHALPPPQHRNCQGQAPVEIYSHQETNDGSASPHNQPSLPTPPTAGGGGGSSGGGGPNSPWTLLPPAPHAPGGGGGSGGSGGSGGGDLFQSMFEDVLHGVFGSIFGGGGPSGAFPFPMPPPGLDPRQQQQQQHQQQQRPPAPPHSFPRGGWQPGAGAGAGAYAQGGGGGGGDVTEI
jgi:hypothetical protein